MNHNWTYKKFGEIIKPAKIVKNGNNNDLPVLSITMREGIVLQSSRFKKTIASVDTSSYKVVKNGQLVIAFPIDEGLIYTQDIVDAGIMSPAYNIWDVDFSELNRRFLVIYLHCPFAMNYYKSKLRGTTMRRRSIPKDDLLNIPIPLPPLETQSRIVAELDLLQSIIDKQKAQLTELDNLAQAVFYDMFGDPVENDKGWEVKKLGEVTNKISDGVHAKPNYTETGMPFISVVNINRGKLIFDDCKYVSQTDGETFNKRTKPEKGDILYTKVGATYGISALVDVDIDFCLYVSVCLIKPKRELFDSVFLTHMMRLPYIKNQADERIRGIGVPDLHLNQISAFDVIVPPLSLQQTFAAKIESIEKQKAAIGQSIAETQKLFNFTMDKYFG